MPSRGSRTLVLQPLPGHYEPELDPVRIFSMARNCTRISWSRRKCYLHCWKDIATGDHFSSFFWSRSGWERWVGERVEEKSSSLFALVQGSRCGPEKYVPSEMAVSAARLPEAPSDKPHRTSYMQATKENKRVHMGGIIVRIFLLILNAELYLSTQVSSWYVTTRVSDVPVHPAPSMGIQVTEFQKSQA